MWLSQHFIGETRQPWIFGFAAVLTAVVLLKATVTELDDHDHFIKSDSVPVHYSQSILDIQSIRHSV